MSKANQKHKPRKRSNVSKKLEKKILKTLPKINPIVPQEAQYFEGLVKISNVYAKTRQQYGQYELAVSAIEKNIEKVKTGEYKTINVPIGPETTTTINDKDEIIKYLNSQLVQLRTALDGIKGQLENKSDLFIETGLRTEAFLKQKFGEYRVKKISENRELKNTKEDEKILFEAEFDALVNDDKKQKEMKEALKKAEAANKK